MAPENGLALGGQNFRKRGGQNFRNPHFSHPNSIVDHSLKAVSITEGATEHGRIYSNLSQMAKSLRSELKIDGEETVEIDIANAHPLAVLQIIDASGIPADELDLWREWAAAGSLYDEIATGLRISRSDVKLAFAKIISTEHDRIAVTEKVNGKWQYREGMFGVSRALKGFRIVFPKLYKALRDAAREEGGLWHRCNQIEKRLLRSKALYRRLHRAGIVTGDLHDGLIVKKSEADRVMGLVRDLAQRLLGRLTMRIKGVGISTRVTPPVHLTWIEYPVDSAQYRLREFLQRLRPPKEVTST